METTKEQQEKKNKSWLGGCLIIFMVLLITPLLVIGALYFINDNFKMNANQALAGMPGGIGEYFSSFPTEAEKREQVSLVADHILKLPHDRAVDKLLILRGEDVGVYDDVVRSMLRVNPNQTRVILEKIRLSTLAPDVLSNTLIRIQEEEDEMIKNFARELSEMPIHQAVEVIHQEIDKTINGHYEVAKYFDHMPIERATTLIYQLDIEDRNRIFSHMSGLKKDQIQNMKRDELRRREELEQLALSYRTEPAQTLVQRLGHTNVYSFEELAILYRGIGPKKSGEVLAKMEDQDLARAIIMEIRNQEISDRDFDRISQDYLKSLKVYKTFDDNIKELSRIYADMPDQRVVEILKDMLLHPGPSEVYELENGEWIMITDEDVAIAIMNAFPQTRRAELLTKFDATLSTEITRKLALPAQ